MKKYTQKAIKRLVTLGAAQDITYHGISEYTALNAEEGGYSTLGYSSGVYGCNGLLIRGNNTGTLYAVTGRTSTIFIYH